MDVDPEDGGTEASTNTYEIDALETALPIAGAKSPALLCVTMAIVSPGTAWTSSATRRAMRGGQRLGRLEQRRCEYRAEEKAGHVSRVGPNGTLVVIPLG